MTHGKAMKGLPSQLLLTTSSFALLALDVAPGGARVTEIRAVYSIGGGNIATLRAFEDAGRECAVFIA
ncbi:hypothetical protein ABZ462_21255, partial [Streptomyces albogriseolus]